VSKRILSAEMFGRFTGDPIQEREDVFCRFESDTDNIGGPNSTTVFSGSIQATYCPRGSSAPVRHHRPNDRVLIGGSKKVVSARIGRIKRAP
jgi:hypothetical protein